MKFPSFSKGGEVGFNMTPMIDVVFQLIIFFLVSSHLAKQEAHLKLPLPEAQSGIQDKPSEKPRLTVNVLADGTLYFGGREVTAEELRVQLAERKSEVGEEVEVRIRGDRGAPYKHIEPVLRACARAGIWNVKFANFPKESGR
jgi:biopolymer transport protein ExbD